ncbi:methyl-accepting chemotaxis protein [Lutispora thermophila]|uniref:Methyl-accepting chemotaxis sensory transducer with Cache sensor n=1 Tax=Lutispora thermophila DSM 19022 TaxID=1122184 RepID=A0A1M6D683_9FIRM|nr:methyl-accepting chemotaxis protein [Lutispora thermophila]SHI68661.1 methyl-accepting chemotaxis sensory transducer with Cache sensor [Lutispora thermophila DSM 19022]
MKKISTKIIALLGLLVFFVCLGLGLVAYITSYNSLVAVLKETMPKVAMEASITIEDGVQNQFNKLNIIASLDYMNILNNPEADNSALRTILSDEVKRSGHKKMMLIGKDGQALCDNGTFADMRGNVIFEKALSGKAVVSDPMLDDNGTEIIMIYAVPVKVDGEIAGVLMAIRDGMELSDFAGRIKFGETGEAFIINSQGHTIAHADKNLLSQIIATARKTDSSSSASVIINEPDTVSSATITADTVTSASAKDHEDVMEEKTPSQSEHEENINSKLGFDGLGDIKQQMMKGNADFGEYKYNGIAKVLGYAPIKAYGWSIAVVIDKEEMLSGLSALKQTFLIISSLFLIGGLVIAFLIGKNISKPITYLSQECNIMSSGDFSRVVEEKYTRRHDEIGGLARGFNNINVKVSKIIRNVVEEAHMVGKAIENVNGNMTALTSEIDFMSSIINKLSSKMDENSAMAEEMSAASSEIEGAIDSIASKTQDGAESVEEVRMRAEELKTIVIDSQKRAQEIGSNVAVKLREAIEKSKNVEKIKILSDGIIKIASQTNLLALNAAIEASQAGSAGAGFAVVAGEIRNLAENSKQIANEIHSVTTLVLESVQDLAVSAEEVLEFLDNKVVRDYDMLVVTGEQYSNDAQFINDMVANLRANTEQLYASVRNMVKAINDIAAASEEGATETGDLANEAAAVVRRTNEVLEKTNDVNKSAERLLELVSIFKV